MTTDNNKPIYILIKEMIENMILTDILAVDDQVPSTTSISNEYEVNHITVLKAINLLVDENIIYKKRGIGMYVSTDAKKIIVLKRKEEFYKKYIAPLKKEAKFLKISLTEIVGLLNEEDEKNETKNKESWD